MKPAERIDKALAIALRSKTVVGTEPMAWVIDQMVRVLAGDDYERIIARAKDEYGWNTGIRPEGFDE